MKQRMSRTGTSAVFAALMALASCNSGSTSKPQPSASNTLPVLTHSEIVELRTMGETAIKSAQTGTKLLAVCGKSTGRSYYVGNKTTTSSDPDAWENDAIPNGRIVVLESREGNPKVLFRGATGELYDLAVDGGKVSYAFKPHENGDFGVIAYYPETGLTEVYSLIQNRRSERVMLWTSNKPNMTFFSKSGAFAARCL